jgi:hypothetical protein
MRTYQWDKVQIPVEPDYRNFPVDVFRDYELAEEFLREAIPPAGYFYYMECIEEDTGIFLYYIWKEKSLIE